MHINMYIKKHRITLNLFIAGLGCKQQDILLSSFIKRVYAEIERNEDPSHANIKQRREIHNLQGESSGRELSFPVRRRIHKKAMTTPEAIAELKLLCKEYDPCLIYTDMIKIGEG